MDRGVVPTNQNPRLTRLRHPRSVRGDREGRIGSLWVFTIGVQVHRGEQRKGGERGHGGRISVGVRWRVRLPTSGGGVAAFSHLPLVHLYP